MEEEFHLVDLRERVLSGSAERLLRIGDQLGAGLEAELQRSEVETATPVCTTLPELRDQIAAARRALVAAADRAGVGVATAGTLPTPVGENQRAFPKRRYERLVEEYAEVGREQHVCASQTQVGVADPELAVAALPRVAPWLPALLALSSSSPFYDGRDTGYASYRAVLWSRWPTSGPPPASASAADYRALADDLVRTGAIADTGMIYFDVRPSARYPTLEIRICDAVPLLEDVVTLAGLARALVVTAVREVGEPTAGYRPELVRAASWRAARSGLSDVLVDPLEPVARPARQVVDALLEHVRPALDELGDAERVLTGVEGLLRRGTSADRQRAAYERAGRLTDAVDELLAETRRDV